MHRKKTSYLAILAVIATLLTIWACTKDAEDNIIDIFGFTVKEEHTDSGHIYEGIGTSLSVVLERPVSTTRHFFTYRLLEGNGFYQDRKGKSIMPRDTVPMEEMDWEMDYLPQATGRHRVLLSVFDTNGQQEDAELSYTVSYAPFTLLVNKGAERFTINAKNPLEVSLLGNGAETEQKEEGDGYGISYKVLNGTGTLLMEGMEGNGEGLVLPRGQNKLSYVPETLGEHTIEITATATDGGTRSASLAVIVEHLDFEVIATANGSKTEVGTELPITVNLKNLGGDTDVTYAMALELQGKGTVLDATGLPVIAGKQSPIEPGEHRFRFLSNAIGGNTVHFDVEDSNGQKKRDSVSIEVTNVPFSFTGSGESNTVFINQETRFNFNLSSNGNTGSVKYFLTYQIEEGNGRLYGPQGTELPSTSPYEVGLGNIRLTYVPTTLGRNGINIKVTDSNGQEGSTVPISLMAENVKLTFQMNVAKLEMIQKLHNTVTVSLVEDSKYADVSYELSHFITGGTASLYDRIGNPVASSIYAPILPGEHVFDFVPQLPGNYVLTFNVRDSNGQILTVSKNIVVRPTDFAFSASFANSTIALGNTNAINFGVSPTAVENGATYMMSYESNLNGVLKYGGVEYGPGQQIPIGFGQSSGIYVPTVVGEYQLDFTVLDSNGTERGSLATMEVQNGAYTFNASASPKTFFVSEDTTLSLDLAQVTANASASYEVMYTSDSSLEIVGQNGNVIGPGIFVPLSLGATQWTLSSDDTGAVSLDITVRDNALVEKQRTIALTVKEKDYTLGAIASTNNQFINVAVPITVTLTELAQNANETYEAHFTASKRGHLLYNGNTYAFGERFPVPKGNTTLSYVGEEEGLHKVTFSIVSGSGISRTAVTEINFGRVPFELDFSPGDNSLTVGDMTDLNINVHETSGSSTYRVKYNMLSGSGTIRSASGNALAQGTYYDVPSGPTSWRFTATSEGTANIQLSAINATGTERTKNASVDVRAKDFAFTATPSPSSAFVGQAIDINVSLTELDTGGETYTVFYSNSSLGKLNFNGAEYAPGQHFTIAPGNHTFKYTGEGKGSHNLVFTVTSSAGLSKTKNVSMDYDYVEYSVSANEGQDELVVGEKGLVHFHINETNGSSTYRMRYQYLSGSPEVFDQNGNGVVPGSWYNVPAGGFDWSVGADGAQAITLQFTVENTTGLQKTAIANFIYSEYEEPFSMKITQSSGIKLSGEAFDLNLNITAEGVHRPGVAYTMRYTHENEDTGYVIYNGTQYGEGETFTVAHGSSTFQFFTTSVTNTDFDVEFIVGNSTGEQEDETENIELYRRPVLTNIRTARDKYNEDSCGNGCNWDNSYMIDFEMALDPSATGGEATLRVYNNNSNNQTVGWKTYTVNPAIATERNGYYEFLYDHFVPTFQALEFDGEPYEIFFTDSNGVKSVLYSGTFTDDDGDSQ